MYPEAPPQALETDRQGWLLPEKFKNLAVALSEIRRGGSDPVILAGDDHVRRARENGRPP
jgi:hypothetical protein